jgi:hypothetical protein
VCDSHTLCVAAIVIAGGRTRPLAAGDDQLLYGTLAGEWRTNTSLDAFSSRRPRGDAKSEDGSYSRRRFAHSDGCLANINLHAGRSLIRWIQATRCGVSFSFTRSAKPFCMPFAIAKLQTSASVYSFLAEGWQPPTRWFPRARFASAVAGRSPEIGFSPISVHTPFLRNGNTSPQSRDLLTTTWICTSIRMVLVQAPARFPRRTLRQREIRSVGRQKARATER